MENIGLILEGGGMRGVYTNGVLDYFMEKGLYFPYVIGVSAGACSGASYVAKQAGRTQEINRRYMSDKRYLSIENYFKHGSFFGMDFLFDEIPNKLVPFDYESFFNSKQKMVTVVTNCETGKAEYFEKENLSKSEFEGIIRASSSLPLGSPMVSIKSRCYLDGGVADSIPIKKALNDGNEKNVVILTRNMGYRKKPFKLKKIALIYYRKYPKFTKALLERYKNYNESMEILEKLEKEGKIFIIRPVKKIEVGRMERNIGKLEALYKEGYNDAEAYYEKMMGWIKN